MAEIYERWTAAHAIVIVTPVYWYPSAQPLETDDRPAGLR
jgi:multimeric flavodoxin WrbA